VRKNRGKLQVPESKEKNTLAFLVPSSSQYEPMKKQPIPTKMALRPTPEDFSIAQRLRAKLGIDYAQILRLGLRKLAESEGLSKAS